jgi:multiple sugar transport system ATP-binding protein
VRPGPATLGVRPEHVRLDPASPLRGRVVFDEYLGATRCLHLDTPLGRLIARVASDALGTASARGAELGLALDPAHVRLFDPVTGTRLA